MKIDRFTICMLALMLAMFTALTLSHLESKRAAQLRAERAADEMEGAQQ